MISTENQAECPEPAEVYIPSQGGFGAVYTGRHWPLSCDRNLDRRANRLTGQHSADIKAESCRVLLLNGKRLLSLFVLSHRCHLCALSRCLGSSCGSWWSWPSSAPTCRRSSAVPSPSTCCRQTGKQHAITSGLC